MLLILIRAIFVLVIASLAAQVAKVAGGFVNPAVAFPASEQRERVEAAVGIAGPGVCLARLRIAWVMTHHRVALIS